MVVLKTKISGNWVELAGEVNASNPINDFISYWTPTPWVTLTLQNGFTYKDTRPLQVRRIGDLVYLRGNLAPGTMGTDCAVLPVGYRPPQTVETICFAYVSSWQYQGILIDTNGYIRINPNALGTPNNIGIYLAPWQTLDAKP